MNYSNLIFATRILHTSIQLQLGNARLHKHCDTRHTCLQFLNRHHLQIHRITLSRHGSAALCVWDVFRPLHRATYRGWRGHADWPTTSLASICFVIQHTTDAERTNTFLRFELHDGHTLGLCILSTLIDLSDEVRESGRAGGGSTAMEIPTCTVYMHLNMFHCKKIADAIRSHVRATKFD